MSDSSSVFRIASMPLGAETASSTRALHLHVARAALSMLCEPSSALRESRLRQQDSIGAPCLGRFNKLAKVLRLPQLLDAKQPSAAGEASQA